MNKSVPKGFKVCNIRIEEDLYLFLKRHAFERNIPMTQIFIDCMNKFRKKIESNLTK